MILDTKYTKDGETIELGQDTQGRIGYWVAQRDGAGNLIWMQTCPTYGEALALFSSW